MHLYLIEFIKKKYINIFISTVTSTSIINNQLFLLRKKLIMQDNNKYIIFIKGVEREKYETH